MIEKIRIRQPGRKDKGNLMKLVKGLYGKSQTEQIEIWNKGYENYLSWTYIAELDGKIVGYISLGGDMTSLFIGDLYIIPKYRRKGIASKFIELSIARAKKAGKDYLKVNARKWNKDSQRLYKKFGFKIMGDTKSGLFLLQKTLSN